MSETGLPNAVDIWLRLLLRSTPDNLDAFLNRLDAELPLGWSQDHAYQVERGHGPNRFRVYLFDIGHGPSIRAWLRRVNPCRVRGSTVQVLRGVNGPPRPILDAVQELISLGVRPLAKELGVFATTPTLGPRSVVPWGTMWSLTEFADRFGGAWPLPADSDELWRKCVGSAREDRAALEPAEFQNWLTDSGWDGAAAANLVARFYRGFDRFADSDDRRRPA